MPRKPLDVRKGRVRLLMPKANQNPTDVNRSGCAFRPYLPIHTPLRGSRQAERGINSRLDIGLYVNFNFKFKFRYVRSMRHFVGNFNRFRA